jgi:hypothetical protein
MEMAAYSHPYGRTGGGRPGARPVRRVRWDRLGRLAMLCLLLALLFLYISAGVSLFSTWREANRTNATVSSMQREYRTLEAQHAALESPGWLETQARILGMMFPGERQYFVRGLPSN